jgi:hypothetical protein
MTMTAAGLPVPPGFTITTQCCAEYYESGKKWPKGLEQELRQALDWLRADLDGWTDLLEQGGPNDRRPARRDAARRLGIQAGVVTHVRTNARLRPIFVVPTIQYATSACKVPFLARLLQ